MFSITGLVKNQILKDTTHNGDGLIMSSKN